MPATVSRVDQVSVFLENRPGRLVEMLQVLENTGINIQALSLADAPDFGIVRMVLPDVGKGVEVLHEAGFTARSTQVLKVQVPHRPGGLVDTVAQPLARAGLNVEYLYASVDPAPGQAVVVVKVRDLEAAERALTVG
ncbi:MAG TPA: amino acid-binding protein [Dehalococcoidia bacterium]|nr:amino acid-binding protein [Dehalococcoidia bacterium]